MGGEEFVTREKENSEILIFGYSEINHMVFLVLKNFWKAFTSKISTRFPLC